MTKKHLHLFNDKGKICKNCSCGRADNMSNDPALDKALKDLNEYNKQRKNKRWKVVVRSGHGTFEEVTMKKETKETVYEAIQSELDYQDQKWGSAASSGQPGNGDRTLDEFGSYIFEYADQMRKLCGTTLDPEEKLNACRKVAALCVACMEQHGAVKRK